MDRSITALWSTIAGRCRMRPARQCGRASRMLRAPVRRIMETDWRQILAVCRKARTVRPRDGRDIKVRPVNPATPITLAGNRADQTQVRPERTANIAGTMRALVRALVQVQAQARAVIVGTMETLAGL